MRNQGPRKSRAAGWLAASVVAGVLVVTQPVVRAGAAAPSNACSNPVLAKNLTGWGSLDHAAISRDTVGDLHGARWAFATAGRRFYQPELSGIAAGQHWTVTTQDRVLNAAGTATTLVDFYNSADSYLGEITSPKVDLPRSTGASGVWIPVSFTFRVPAGAVQAHILQLGDFGSSTHTAFKATACNYELQSPSTPSGVPMPIGTLPADSQGPRGWRQVFSDDFTATGKATADGALPDGKWWGYASGTPITNSPNGVYDSARTVTEGDGELRFHLHSEDGTAYAAVESPKLSGSQTYGRYDVRYRYEPGSNIAGYKSVWMTWPDTDRWNEGELDFQEYGNAANRTSVSAALHRACASAPCPTTEADTSLDPTQWHTATEIWSPGKVTAFVDGQLITSTTFGVPTTPMHLLLQTEASDYGPIATPSSVTNIDVDWVVVYSRN